MGKEVFVHDGNAGSSKDPRRPVSTKGKSGKGTEGKGSSKTGTSNGNASVSSARSSAASASQQVCWCQRATYLRSTCKSTGQGSDQLGPRAYRMGAAQPPNATQQTQTRPTVV